MNTNSAQIWITIREAIRGWGPTLRLIALLVTATTCVIAARVAFA